MLLCNSKRYGTKFLCQLTINRSFLSEVSNKLKKFREDWNEMQKASGHPAEEPWEPPSVNKSSWKELPPEYKKMVRRETWNIAKLMIFGDRDSKKTGLDIMTQEMEIRNHMKIMLADKYLRNHLRSLGMNEEQIELKIKQMEEEKRLPNMLEKKLGGENNNSDITDGLDEMLKESGKNVRELLKSLVSRRHGVKEFAEGRLQVMQEALTDLLDGYQEGKKEAVANVLSKDDYFEDLKSQMWKVTEDLQSKIANVANAGTVDDKEGKKETRSDVVEEYITKLEKMLDDKPDEKKSSEQSIETPPNTTISDSTTINKSTPSFSLNEEKIVKSIDDKLSEENIEEGVNKLRSTGERVLKDLVREPMSTISNLIEESEREEQHRLETIQSLIRMEIESLEKFDRDNNTTSAVFQHVSEIRRKEIGEKRNELIEAVNELKDSFSSFKSSIHDELSKVEKSLEDEQQKQQSQPNQDALLPLPSMDEAIVAAKSAVRDPKGLLESMRSKMDSLIDQGIKRLDDPASESTLQTSKSESVDSNDSTKFTNEDGDLKREDAANNVFIQETNSAITQSGDINKDNKIKKSTETGESNSQNLRSRLWSFLDNLEQKLDTDNSEKKEGKK